MKESVKSINKRATEPNPDLGMDIFVRTEHALLKTHSAGTDVAGMMRYLNAAAFKLITAQCCRVLEIKFF